MPRLPTVTLRHKRTGKIEKRNRTEYSRNIARYANNWVLVTEARGDATDAQVRQDARESKLNQYRKENPGEQAWRGDKQRRYEERKISEPIYTSDYAKAQASANVADVETEEALEWAVNSMAEAVVDDTDYEEFDQAVQVQENKKHPIIEAVEETIKELQEVQDSHPAYDDTWETMAWFKAAAYVKEKTGTRPRNKAHARRLMGWLDDDDA